MQANRTSSDLLLQENTIQKLYPELFAGIDALANAGDETFARRYPHFVAELESDFAMEEEWMEELRCNELRYHREQHAELLRLLHHAHNRLLTGDLTLGRKVMALLPQWFSVHISQMDLIWAAASVQQQQSAMPAMREAA